MNIFFSCIESSFNCMCIHVCVCMHVHAYNMKVEEELFGVKKRTG